MASISYTTKSFERRVAKQALQRNITEQWQRVLAAEVEFDVANEAYLCHCVDHAELCIAMLDTFPFFDNALYIANMREFALLRLSVIMRLDTLSVEQDKYNELVIALEDWDTVTEDEIDDEVDCDECPCGLFDQVVPDIKLKRCRRTRRKLNPATSSEDEAKPPKQDRTRSKEHKTRSAAQKKRVYLDIVC